ALCRTSKNGFSRNRSRQNSCSSTVGVGPGSRGFSPEANRYSSRSRRLRVALGRASSFRSQGFAAPGSFPLRFVATAELKPPDRPPAQFSACAGSPAPPRLVRRQRRNCNPTGSTGAGKQNPDSAIIPNDHHFFPFGFFATGGGGGGMPTVQPELGLLTSPTPPAHRHRAARSPEYAAPASPSGTSPRLCPGNAPQSAADSAALAPGASTQPPSSPRTPKHPPPLHAPAQPEPALHSGQA